MVKVLCGYRLKGTNNVIFNKSTLNNDVDKELEILNVFISKDDIKEWAEELKFLEDEDF